MMEFLNISLKDFLLRDIGVAKKDDIETLVKKLLTEPLSMDHGKEESLDSTIRQTIADSCLANEEYEYAIDLYTNQLQENHAFSKVSRDAYIRRSLALEKLACYEESLQDIDRALELTFPMQLRQSLGERQVRIKSKMSNDKTAEANRKAAKKSYYKIPTLSHEESDVIPGCSSAISAKYDREHGRHFVARKPIKLGDVLLIEKPMVVFPISNKNNIMLCCNCMKYSIASIPCDFCDFALYCSKECREEAYEKYHKMECNFGIRKPHIRLAIMLLLKLTDNGARMNEAIEYCKKLDALDKVDSFFNDRTPDQLIGNDIERVLNLSCPMHVNDVINEKIIAASTATVLRNYSNVMHGSNEVVDLAKLLYRLLYIINIHHTQVKFANAKDLKALGIYPLCEMIYHSCSANAIFTLQENNVMALRASKDIEPGDVITFNFLKEVIKVPTPLRRDVLMQERNIACRCGACMANYTFMPELRRKIEIPAQLKRRLRKCSIDIPSMWELLKLIDNDIKRPCLEIEMLKIAIQDAYLHKESPALWTLYNGLGVF